MDRDAGHDVAPRGGCERYCPEAVGSGLRRGERCAVIEGDCARVASLDHGVVLHVAADAEPRVVHSAERTVVSAVGGLGDGLVSPHDDCPVRSPHRFPPATTACAAGMDSLCKSIFLRTRMAVMDWVRHVAVGGPASGGRTMKGRGAGETRSYGPARPRAVRQGPASHSPPGAERLASMPRYRERAGDTGRCGALMRGAGRLAGGRRGICGAGRVGRGAGQPINRAKAIGCFALQALRDGSARYRLTRDNCCYRESNGRFQRLRPATAKPPCRDPQIVGRAVTLFKPLVRCQVSPAGARETHRPPTCRRMPAVRRSANLTRDNIS